MPPLVQYVFSKTAVTYCSQSHFYFLPQETRLTQRPHCTMLPLSTKTCLKSSKLRPILNGQFCHAISKNICLYVFGSKQPREILVFVILKLTHNGRSKKMEKLKTFALGGGEGGLACLELFFLLKLLCARGILPSAVY